MKKLAESEETYFLV